MLIPKGGGWRGMQVRGMDKFLKMLIKFHRVGKQTSIKSFKKAPPGGTNIQILQSIKQMKVHWKSRFSLPLFNVKMM